VGSGGKVVVGIGLFAVSLFVPGVVGMVMAFVAGFLIVNGLINR